ncbi:hypothetical protein RHSIM_Rhsim12G0135900 [Rhododendron simsii]|uniref:Pentatricopeptide repeat-containing protein n=1 Tax=Rhododendron simsii TaxID=118357 RepID=A0A834G592_RHOSS|nr:hypothetical protein RHSIM_Rhsim12G0135900 [Rhododendron simsii]
MASSIAMLTKSRSIIKKILTHHHHHDSLVKSITTSSFLSQQPQLAEQQPHHPSPPSPEQSPLPPNPASGSPLYNENWRNPIQPTSSSSASLIPLNFIHQESARIQVLSQTLDLAAVKNVFADWTASQRWGDMKQLFEFWIRSLDGRSGKPNKPDVDLYNLYLRANVMTGASAGELLDLVARMEDYGIVPNTASFNLVLKAMHQARETAAAEKLIERMLQSGKESLPDDESYDLVIGMLFLTDQIDSALKYVDLTLKYGYILSVKVFTECVRSCVDKGRLDTLVSIIDRCKKMDQNKALCPTWNLCNYIADVAMQEDNTELAYFSLEFMAKWIAIGDKARPPVLLSVDEGLVVAALGTAGRTYNTKLLDGSWALLKRSLRQKKAPNPESYLAKIYAQASLGNLQKAFSTLHELETAYGSSTTEAEENLFSPFTSLYPLVVACSKNGFVTLDSVYYQLENLSQADPPYKSVAALNCIILGCSNTWDVDRAYQTFEAISSTFGLIPNTHSYNALMNAFGKLKKTSEASSVFEHMISKGVKPNATTYSVLVDAHLVERDPKAALSVIDQMVNEGFEPSREMLKKVRRRCMREMDYTSNDKVTPDDLEEILQLFTSLVTGHFRLRNLLHWFSLVLSSSLVFW